MKRMGHSEYRPNWAITQHQTCKTKIGEVSEEISDDSLSDLVDAKQKKVNNIQ